MNRQTIEWLLGEVDKTVAELLADLRPDWPEIEGDPSAWAEARRADLLAADEANAQIPDSVAEREGG